MLWMHIATAIINLDLVEYVDFGNNAHTTVEIGLSSGKKATISKDLAVGAFSAPDILSAINTFTPGPNICLPGTNAKLVVTG